ncbi:MAG: DUF3500 domain-containing protein [Hymenobacter sp.]|nr:MAG: DUF3500 domain-containing protein [Hymenobacter sp.]
MRPLAAKSVQKATQTTSVGDVATAANAFIATLSQAQQATLLQTFNSTNVKKWSNLPCGSQCRIGLQLSSLTATQQAAALAVVQAATGTGSGEGYDEIQKIRAADDYLAANGGGSGYGSGIYFIAFLVTNTSNTTIGATDQWMLQFGGHHLATNITFGNGYITGPTPKFEGVEPLSFTSTGGIFPSGTTVAPLNEEEAGMAALFASLTTAQKTTAKLSQTFSDVVLGPGSDGQFPATRVGLQCSTLTSAQQALVVAAMAPWVKDVDDATGTQLLNYYQTQLANTYISYSGTGLFTSNADYARIDGPNAWIEFVCQTGVVFRNNIHYHSIYRDRARDYGGNFYGTYTTVLGTKSAAAATVFSLFPNPAYSGADLQVRLSSASAGTYTVRDLLGRQVATGPVQNSEAAVPTAGIVPGTYLLTVETPGQAAVTSRFQVQ